MIRNLVHVPKVLSTSSSSPSTSTVLCLFQLFTNSILERRPPAIIEPSVRWSTTTTTTTCTSTSTSTSDQNVQEVPKNPLKCLDKHLIRQELLQAWMIAEASNSSSSNSRSYQRSARYCCYTYDDAKRDYSNRKSTWHWLDSEMSSNLAGETGAVSIYRGAIAALSLRQRIKRMLEPVLTSQNNDTTTMPETTALEFCYEHYKTEESHRQFFHDVLPPHSKRTRLLPLWRLAGYTLGFVPTLIGGPTVLYVTVESVETFVETHFQEQIVPLQQASAMVTTSSPSSTNLPTPSLPPCPELLKLLEACCEDEVHHKHDAASKLLYYNGGTGGSDITTAGSDKNNNATETSLANTFPSHHLWWARPWSRIVQMGSSIAADIARKI